MRKKFAPAILDYYDANELPLLSNLDVYVYICPKWQRTRPTKPSYCLGQVGVQQLRVNSRVYKLIRKASI